MNFFVRLLGTRVYKDALTLSYFGSSKRNEIMSKIDVMYMNP